MCRNQGKSNFGMVTWNMSGNHGKSAWLHGHCFTVIASQYQPCDSCWCYRLGWKNVEVRCTLNFGAWENHVTSKNAIRNCDTPPYLDLVASWRLAPPRPTPPHGEATAPWQGTCRGCSCFDDLGPPWASHFGKPRWLSGTSLSQETADVPLSRASPKPNFKMVLEKALKALNRKCPRWNKLKTSVG